MDTAINLVETSTKEINKCKMCARMNKRDAYELQKLANEAYRNWADKPDIVNLRRWHEASENVARATGDEIQKTAVSSRI